MSKLRPTLKRKELQQSTARDFGGGLNLVDSEFNLSSRYAVDGYNMVYDDNGSLQVRWGTRQFADFTGVLSGRIVAIEYYFAFVIAVDSTGQIASANAAGVVTKIWSTAIAAALPGAPTAWTATARANFAPFLSSLIVVNGVDKPLIITNTLSVKYLQDLGSGSNVNTPIAKYVTTHSNYLVMAGDPLKPGRLYISNSGTSGTWFGDAIPNDAIRFDVDKYAPDSIGEITGITSFRDRLVVFFSKFIVSLKLGIYSTATTPVHSPTIDDIIGSFGVVSHRTVVGLGQQMLFLDFTGVSSLRQTTLTNTLSPDRASKLIDTSIQTAMNNRTRSVLQDGAFAVYDRREARVMFFIPTVDTGVSTATMKVYAYSMLNSGKYAWSEYRGWDFQCGCVSVEGRVFFANGLRLYRHGSRYEPVLSDYEGVKPYDGLPSDNVSGYVYGTLSSSATLAVGIDFYHELPQNALQDRTVWKSLHYLTMDTQGSSPFDVQLFTDDLAKRVATSAFAFTDGTDFSDNTGWSGSIKTPTVSMSFIGGDRGAYDVALPMQITPYRATDNMGLYAIYSRFRHFKMAFSGKSHSHLRIIAVSMYYQRGSIY